MPIETRQRARWRWASPPTWIAAVSMLAAACGGGGGGSDPDGLITSFSVSPRSACVNTDVTTQWTTSSADSVALTIGSATYSVGRSGPWTDRLSTSASMQRYQLTATRAGRRETEFQDVSVAHDGSLTFIGTGYCRDAGGFLVWQGYVGVSVPQGASVGVVRNTSPRRIVIDHDGVVVTLDPLQDTSAFVGTSASRSWLVSGAVLYYEVCPGREQALSIQVEVDCP